MITKEESPNVFVPASIRLYPENGTAVLNEDGSVSLTVTAKNTNLWVYAEVGFSLPTGDYTLCMDDGLYVYSSSSFVIQTNSGGQYAAIVTANSNKYHFSLSEATAGNLRIAFNFGANYPTFPITWTGHFWINSGDSEEYSAPGEETIVPKDFIDANQGVENAGKILVVDEDGKLNLANGIEPSDEIQRKVYEKKNLVTYTEVEKGYINSQGGVTPYESIWHSGYMEVEAGTIYCYVGPIIYSQYFAFYDDENGSNPETYSDLGAMTRYTPTIYKINVPEGKRYFRCSFSSDQSEEQTAWVCNIPENPPEDTKYSFSDVYPSTMNPINPCDYSELSVRAFSKVVCIGDSLTYGGFNMDDNSGTSGQTQSSAELSERYSYPSNFQRITGIETVNEGDSGETTVSWYANHSTHDFSEYDLAIIHLGVNDSAFHVSDSDTLTAMQNIVTLLNNARSDMKIAICSVIPAYDGTGYQAKGQLILNWAKNLNNANIIPVDLARFSHVRPRTSYVAGHLSAYGYYMMALDIAKYISWYMDNNKRDFRFIQFIGSSDASWSGD